jgi:hypothetical protein
LTAYSQWIKNILVPYRQSVIETDDLDNDQMAIVYLDCYPVHTGEEFHYYVWEKHPYIILYFVPANCKFILKDKVDSG